MPTFNFDQDASSKSATAIAPGPMLTFAETFGGGTGVTFTLSASNVSGSAYAYSDGIAGGTGLYLSGFTPNDIGDAFTLTAQTTGGLDAFGGPVALDIAVLSGTWRVDFLGATAGAVQTIASGGVVQADGSEITGIRFTVTGNTNNAFLVLDSLTVNSFACFTAGTRIATPGGNVDVETLQEGDTLRTAGGGTTRVRWVGTRQVSTRFADPAKVNPICVEAHALGPNTPARDLWLSDDHALFLDGVLVNAGALVNGTTITRLADMPEVFTYYHVETEAHEVILAENCPAETFVDYSGLNRFDNASTRTGAPVPEMSAPRITSARALPVSLRARLARRKAA